MRALASRQAQADVGLSGTTAVNWPTWDQTQYLDFLPPDSEKPISKSYEG